MNRVIIHCGNGRGKTSSAIGIALRSLSHGKKVFIAQFFKPKTDAALLFLQKDNPENLCIRNYGKWYFADKPDAEAASVYKHAIDEIRELINENGCDTVILDEIFYTVQFELLGVEAITDLIAQYDNKCFVLTGRNAPPQLLEMADTVSCIECVKHGFDSGIKAQSGVEF